ncbi:amino acid ABC transporter permease [Brevibacterium yomogidense]|uniref:amino acid ABC transporter permease n=1 Tax=Brevibacterium yomogidense TaxID=946573 RepID=UPI0018DF0EC1|nr:amino acid ABC transporter permease [Brevibacterium yomogidense]
MSAQPESNIQNGEPSRDAPSQAYVKKVLPPRNRKTTIFGVLVTIIVTLFLVSIAVNENFRWPIVAEYLFHPNILIGIGNTIALTAISMFLGTILGAILALMKLAPTKTLRWISEGYVWFFRGVPLLVQLLFWYNLAALFPQIGLVLPDVGLDLTLNTNALITPFTAAIISLTLHESAYMAEIIRSGILSVNKGQKEAAEALAITPFRAMTRIVLPQAMRIIIPPTGNQIISMLKTTSLVSVIALNDLLYSAQIIYSVNYRVIQLLLVASIWYIVMVTVLTWVQSKVESHYGKGYVPRKVRKKIGR